MTKVLNNINYRKFIKPRLETLELRRKTVKEELKRHNIKYLCDVEGGMNYYVDLNKDSSKVVPELMKKGNMALIPGCLFEGRASHFARLGFGAVRENEIKLGIASLSSVLSR